MSRASSRIARPYMPIGTEPDVESTSGARTPWIPINVRYRFTRHRMVPMRLPVRLGRLVLVACGGSEPPPAEPQTTASADPGQVHIHGLGVNPSDGSVLIATHTGLFRAAPGSEAAERVGDSYQDTMGFAIVGPDHF